MGYLAEHVPSESATEDDWQDFSSRRSLLYLLPALSGLVKGRPSCQNKAIELNLIPNLYHLSGPSTKNKIGNLAETLLGSLQWNNTQVTEAVQHVIDADAKKKKEIANAARQRILEQMQMRVQPSAKDDDAIGVITVNNNFDCFEDLEEEEFCCKVCREGYEYMPSEVLGPYVYGKRVALSTGEPGYCTVTNFNIIHVACHRQAAEADAHLKPRKEEWEGAMLRNSSTYCNNIFPIRGPEISAETYSQHVDAYWTHYVNQCGRCDLNKYRLLVHDLRQLLNRLAVQGSFSEDSRGGGRESNICIVPFFVQMGLYLLDRDSTRKGQEQALEQFVSREQKDWSKDLTDLDNAHYYVASALFVLGWEAWNAKKMELLQRILYESLAENKSADGEEVSSEVLFSKCKAPLMFFALVDQFQRRMKSEKTEASWPSDLAQAITADLSTFVHLATDVLHYYEETLLPCHTLPSLLSTIEMAEEHCLTEDKIKELYLSSSSK